MKNKASVPCVAYRGEVVYIEVMLGKEKSLTLKRLRKSGLPRAGSLMIKAWLEEVHSQHATYSS